MSNLHNVKLRHKRISAHLILIAFVLSASLAPTSFPLSVAEVEAQTCQPQGDVFASNRHWYNYIANGLPSDTSCWTKTNASVVSTTTCGWTSNAWQFAFGGSISQTFTVPSDKTQPNFSIQYLLDFDDPNNDPGWNRFELEVWDQTSGVLLAYDSFNGGMGDLYCSLRTLSWSQNLAGHTILVYFKGSRGYFSTFIRVRSIALYQRIT